MKTSRSLCYLTIPLLAVLTFSAFALPSNASVAPFHFNPPTFTYTVTCNGTPCGAFTTTVGSSVTANACTSNPSVAQVDFTWQKPSSTGGNVKASDVTVVSGCASNTQTITSNNSGHVCIAVDFEGHGRGDSVAHTLHPCFTVTGAVTPVFPFGTILGVLTPLAAVGLYFGYKGRK